MRYLLFLLTGLCLVISELEAQHIPPKAGLGVSAAPASPGSGAVFQVVGVAPKSTGASLGLQQGDLLLSINSVQIEKGPEISAALRVLAPGDSITLTVRRKERVLPLRGTVRAQQPPVQPGMETLWEEVPFRKGFVRSIVNKPIGAGPFKTIYFLQGYPCQSVNWQSPQLPAVQLIDHWVSQGYAVVRVEKPGVGDFVDCPDCASLNFDDELLSFTNGLRWLRGQSYVNQDQVILFGHSLGGNVAPYLANQFPVRGVMVYGTAVRPWQDYLLRVFREQQPLLGADFVQVEADIKQLRPLLHGLFTENLSPQEMGLTNKQRELLNEYLEMKDDGSFAGRALHFWQGINAHNLTAYWKEVNAPVLAMYGSNDVEALDEQDAERIAAIVNHYHPGSATFRLIPGADHGLVTVPDKLTGMKMRADGSYQQAYLAGVNADLLRTIDDWLAGLDDGAGTPTPKSTTVLRDASKQLPASVTKPNTMDIATADLNGDDHPDLVLAREGHANLILYNDGTGSFAQHQVLKPKHAPSLTQLTGEDSEDLALVDLDQDGDLDLLSATEDTDHHELYWNEGDGN
ncbi:MAG: alpha/beta hydrolase, partial [Bacteroidota bacterium]